jgi:hypothetical protein
VTRIANMPKTCYITHRFDRDALTLIETFNEIIADYRQQGFDLTLRQLYYQCVSRVLVENTERSYRRIGSIINDARLAGLVDWSAIVDRTREFEQLPHWDSPKDLVEAAADQYRIDTRSTQDHYVEVWVEKDALASVIEHACQPLDVGFLSCRGYVSQSTMWASAMRFKRKQQDQTTHVIHLGDHDPSGLDMTRDIQERMNLFGADVVVKRIALTMEQVREYNPPPNPAKMTDSRFEAYANEYGEESWELDALDPSVLNELITTAVLEYTDEDERDFRIELQEEQREKLNKIAKKLE